jgi:hypothetical protein
MFLPDMLYISWLYVLNAFDHVDITYILYVFPVMICMPWFNIFDYVCIIQINICDAMLKLIYFLLCRHHDVVIFLD